jgi:hypothetical protein
MALFGVCPVSGIIRGISGTVKSASSTAGVHRFRVMMQDCGRSLASASAIKRETVSSGRRPGDCIASQARRVPGHRRRRSSHRKARSQEAERASFAARPRHAKATHWRAGARQRCGSRGYQDAVATSQGSPPPWPVPTYWGRAFFVHHILTAGARAVQGRLPPDGRGCQRDRGVERPRDANGDQATPTLPIRSGWRASWH